MATVMDMARPTPTKAVMPTTRMVITIIASIMMVATTKGESEQKKFSFSLYHESFNSLGSSN